ncbi:hypothetical protein [Halioglobus sp. HI00S01]|uniref:hypothetical protein n=1 Tax=Halioglobus sp. HI00S01 TaxID=1822214 RepID=UPI0012E92DB0|nr:hypothetical protein [Halioglobus sp. HI00S01]
MAYVQSPEIRTAIDDTEHHGILDQWISRGAQWISFDPFKTDSFVICPNAEPHLPAADECAGAIAIDVADAVYLFEDGCLALNPRPA